MKTQLEKLKAYLLDNCANYHNGFANVSKPDGTNIIIDDNGNYSGISDDNGNYFYIRSLKESTLGAVRWSCKPIFYKRSTKCRIVSITKNLEEENQMNIIIAAISEMGHEVNRTVSEKTQVFFEETGTRNLIDGLKKVSLFSVDFEVIDKVSANNCNQVKCEC